jgi:hypothetical protein
MPIGVKTLTQYLDITNPLLLTLLGIFFEYVRQFSNSNAQTKIEQILLFIIKIKRDPSGK